MKTIASVTLPHHVHAPRYDRQQLQSRIVHFGFGAFHRAHQALLTDRVLNAQGGDWGICEISLFSGDQLMSQLRAQNHLYTVLEKGADGNQVIIVGAVHECLNAKLDSLAAIIEKFCEPQVAIVSLTITEKGYCIDPATGALDTSNPRIIHDLQTPEEPHSAPGILVEALKRRRERSLTPFTVLSCDNIPDNGHVVKNAVLRMAEISQHLGVNDPCAISCEPFIQWVVEDNFIAGRPAWEVAGVQMVNDVLPWEEMKLRMLNGSHSFLAYLGYLSGFAYISDCMQDRVFRYAARTLMLDEQAPTLQIKDVDLTQYADKLIARFANPSLKHKTWQIAMDGSQKLPQRMLAGIRIHLGRETDWSLLALGVAGWMRYVSGVDDAGNAIDVRDPLSDKIRELVAGSSSEQRVTALLSLREVFGDDLPDNPHFVQAIEQAWQQIVQFGAHQALLNTLKI
ncbi:mannitol dehydrogenase family protein [Shigella flexneri 1c]|uniref:mannitol dehydrogenase family protein n=1 Tax=Shigella flexneri TaxID=623 RepID=UPI000BC362CD|nr:mannitol dehydrogenase family protein [Shigella flexneri]ATH68529.1 mannitol dehydrogenase family protein [Shigella flexneri 1c]HBD6252099.1 mannitol dehydrogenase family protein [Shigella flexneri]